MILMKHFNQSWSELAAGAGQCYMKPQCVQQGNQKEQDDHSNRNLSRHSRSRGCMALYMPYLTIGSYGCIDHGPVTNAPKVFDESNNNRDSRRIKHTPMTLDQYYYPTITDTSVRDNDQVLSKFLQKKREQEEHENPPRYNDGESIDKKILTVSSLWVWILDGKTIITAATDGPDQKSPRSLQEINGNLLEAALRNILYNKDRSVFEGAASVYSVMELILGAATGLFIEKSVITPDQSAKGPVEIFRESIREVANEETSLFVGFLNKLRREAGGQQEQLGQKLSYKPPDMSVSDPHHVISSEMELLYTIRDIRDELQMLRSLAEDQEIVWEQAFAFIYLKDEPRRFEFYAPTDVKEDLDTMLLEADKIEKYINTLLDLRQAEYGRLQANDSARLSKIIFVFTVITIVFLPLSFLSSLFALDVSVFPHEAGSLKYQGWWLFPILFGATTIVSVPTIFVAWKLDAISAKFKRLEAIPASFKRLEAISAFKRRETTKGGEIVPNTAKTTRWGESLRRRLRSMDDKNDIIPLSSRNEYP
ncbi:hypothetical protein GGR58DRAFT_22443 [Xylaria digitata]|nr:hypothetical protein GGR58DRAFT_22443 [Xylaria digitata]